MSARISLISVATLLAFWVSPAAAQSTIRDTRARAGYTVELEPHLLVGPYNPPGALRGDGYGIGLRATWTIVPQGFISTINDSVGIGFGADFLHYDEADTRGECSDFERGPNGTDICVEVDGGGDENRVLLPVVMQWNFWLHRRWSVFGEPGAYVYLGDDFGVEPAIWGGGRFHATDRFTLTLRVGYPSLSFGASFLF